MYIWLYFRLHRDNIKMMTGLLAIKLCKFNSPGLGYTTGTAQDSLVTHQGRGTYELAALSYQITLCLVQADQTARRIGRNDAICRGRECTKTIQRLFTTASVLKTQLRLSVVAFAKMTPSVEGEDVPQQFKDYSLLPQFKKLNLDYHLLPLQK